MMGKSGEEGGDDKKVTGLYRQQWAPWEIWAHWSASDSNSLIFHMNVLRNDSGMGNEIPLYFTNLENKFPINITEEENQFTWNLLLKSLKMYKRCFSASLDNHK